MQKILMILRHAKAIAAAPGQHDRHRRLSERGVRQARAMGEHLAAKSLLPQRVLCSDAVRTRETLQYLQEGSRGRLEADLEESLYMASAGEMANMLAGAPDGVSSLMILGHNPGMHELVIRLIRDGDEGLINQLATDYPTCALATIAFEGHWGDLPRERGTLLDFVTPEALSN